MYDPHWDLPVLSTTSQNGGADWSNHSLQPAHEPALHPVRRQPGRALSAPQAATASARSASTRPAASSRSTPRPTRSRWRNHLGLDMAHGQAPLDRRRATCCSSARSTATSSRWTPATGKELWQLPDRRGDQLGPGHLYGRRRAVRRGLLGGHRHPVRQLGDAGRHAVGVQARRHLQDRLGQQRGADAGAARRSAAPSAATPVEGSTVNNTVLPGARPNRTADTATAATAPLTGAMSPTHLRVPVGTTVTFLNPGAETFPNFPNQKLHCATQYFEGLFNSKLNPGETFQYTFTGQASTSSTTAPTRVRPARSMVYRRPGRAGRAAVRAEHAQPRPANGVFTGVQGLVTAHVQGAGRLHARRRTCMLKTPLSTTLFPAVIGQRDVRTARR